jgi:hypothetical protein
MAIRPGRDATRFPFLAALLHALAHHIAFYPDTGKFLYG